MPQITFTLTITLALLLLLRVASAYPQQKATTTTVAPLINQQSDSRPGRYVPELHGGNNGRYVPDNSGKYRHIKVPYNGGYGDRGLDYMHDGRGAPPPPPPLPVGVAFGEKDHLRFGIDFNTDGSGWQIVQFEWLRDGDENKRYRYVNEEQLWVPEVPGAGRGNGYASANVGRVTGGSSNAAAPAGYENTNVHVDAEFEGKIYNISYTNDNMKNAPSHTNLQSTVHEVLDYIQSSVLPTLP